MTTIRRVGRPRDPTVEERAKRAALSIYNQGGLRPVSFDAVAREASVGKSALYERWASAEDLLVDALASLVSIPSEIDMGSVAEDLTKLAHDVWTEFGGEFGLVTVRIAVDATTNPRLRDSYDRLVSAYRQAAIAIVRRGVARGELAISASPVVVLDLLIGGILTHRLFARPQDGSHPSRQGAIIDALVRNVLSGAASPGTAEKLSAWMPTSPTPVLTGPSTDTPPPTEPTPYSVTH